MAGGAFRAVCVNFERRRAAFDLDVATVEGERAPRRRPAGSPVRVLDATLVL